MARWWLWWAVYWLCWVRQYISVQFISNNDGACLCVLNKQVRTCRLSWTLFVGITVLWHLLDSPASALVSVLYTLVTASYLISRREWQQSGNPIESGANILVVFFFYGITTRQLNGSATFGKSSTWYYSCPELLSKKSLKSSSGFWECSAGGWMHDTVWGTVTNEQSREAPTPIVQPRSSSEAKQSKSASQHHPAN